MRAAGAYLRVLREDRYSSRQALADELQVDDSQIERVEKGQHAQRGPFIFAFIKAVRGNPDHVMGLILDDYATEDLGRSLAYEWLDSVNKLEPTERDRRRRQAVDIIDALLDDPVRLGALLGYGHRLEEERKSERESQ